jgi:hypothetical protein
LRYIASPKIPCTRFHRLWSMNEQLEDNPKLEQLRGTSYYCGVMPMGAQLLVSCNRNEPPIKIGGNLLPPSLTST